MREGTSGFSVTRKAGKITIEYVDFGVSEFGGGDFEKTYYLDKENSKKFIAALKKECKGSLDSMIEQAFTRNFSDRLFWEFCKQHNITYSSSTWSG